MYTFPVRLRLMEFALLAVLLLSATGAFGQKSQVSTNNCTWYGILLVRSYSYCFDN